MHTINVHIDLIYPVPDKIGKTLAFKHAPYTEIL